jgi:hypothetical protein
MAVLIVIKLLKYGGERREYNLPLMKLKLYVLVTIGKLKVDNLKERFK